MKFSAQFALAVAVTILPTALCLPVEGNVNVKEPRQIEPGPPPACVPSDPASVLEALCGWGYCTVDNIIWEVPPGTNCNDATTVGKNLGPQVPGGTSSLHGLGKGTGDEEGHGGGGGVGRADDDDPE